MLPQYCSDSDFEPLACANYEWQRSHHDMILTAGKLLSCQRNLPCLQNLLAVSDRGVSLTCRATADRRFAAVCEHLICTVHIRAVSSVCVDGAGHPRASGGTGLLPAGLECAAGLSAASRGDGRPTPLTDSPRSPALGAAGGGGGGGWWPSEAAACTCVLCAHLCTA